MKHYTLGFVFNPTLDRVVLIEKTHPDWQKGKLNGIGGKIEESESSAACIVREACEESGLQSHESQWTLVAQLCGTDWRMDVYAHIHSGAEEDMQTKTDEHIKWHNIDRMPNTMLSNVPWLIYLAKDKMQNNHFHECLVRYS